MVRRDQWGDTGLMATVVLIRCPGPKKNPMVEIGNNEHTSTPNAANNTVVYKVIQYTV